MSLVCFWYVCRYVSGMYLVCVSEPSMLLRACVCETTTESCDRTTPESALSHVPAATTLHPPLSFTRSSSSLAIELWLACSLVLSVSLFLTFSLRGSHPGMQWMRPLVHFASYLLAREERLDRRTIVADIPCYLSLRARAGA